MALAATLALGCAFGVAGSPAAVLPSLTLKVAGQGKVVGSYRLSCPGACTVRTRSGTRIRLSARPAAGWRLARWSGACTARLPVCRIVLRKTVTVRASFVPTSPAGTAQLWVDPDGGTCARQPAGGAYADGEACGSFQAAYASAHCGDRVGVRAGAYNTQTLSGAAKSCTPATPVLFTGAPGAACADNTAVALHAFSIQASYVSLHCLSANPAGETRCSDVGNAIPHTVAVWNTLDRLVIRCANFNADHMRVTNSTFGPDNACQTNQEDMIVFRANPDAINDVVFDHVTFATVTAPPDLRCGAGNHVDTMQGYGISNLVISNSLFYGCPGQCVIFRPFNGGVPGPITIENTIVNDVQDPGQAISIGSSSSANGDRCNGPIVVQNNTLVNGAAFHGGCWNGGTVIVRNNIMTSNSCGFGGSGDSYTRNVFYEGTPCGSDARRCRPAYAAATASRTSPGNFHLAAADTCARGAAGQSAGTYPPTDLDGQRRPLGPAVDAGADEIP